MANEVPIGNMVVRLMGDSRHFDRMLGNAQNSMVKAGRRLSQIGREITLGVTAPIVAFGSMAVKAFVNFDDAMSKAYATMGDVSDILKDKMAETAKALSLTTGTSVNKLAEAYYDLGQAGLDATEAMSSLPAINNIMIAGNVDARKAVELLIQSQRKLGKDETYRLLGEVATMAANRAKSALTPWQKLHNEFELTFIELGKDLEPMFRKLNESVREGLKWWRQLSDEQRGTYIKWVMIAAAMGPVLTIMGSMTAMIGGLMAITFSWVGGLVLAAATIMLVSDMFLRLTGNEETGMLKMVESVRIGGVKISTYFGILGLLIMRVWDHAIDEVSKGWMKFLIATDYVRIYLIDAFAKIAQGFLVMLAQLPGAEIFGSKLRAGIDSINNYAREATKNALELQKQDYEKFNKEVLKMSKNRTEKEATFYSALADTIAADRGGPSAGDIFAGMVNKVKAGLMGAGSAVASAAGIGPKTGPAEAALAKYFAGKKQGVFGSKGGAGYFDRDFSAQKVGFGPVAIREGGFGANLARALAMPRGGFGGDLDRALAMPRGGFGGNLDRALAMPPSDTIRMGGFGGKLSQALAMPRGGFGGALDRALAMPRPGITVPGALGKDAYISSLLGSMSTSVGKKLPELGLRAKQDATRPEFETPGGRHEGGRSMAEGAFQMISARRFSLSGLAASGGKAAKQEVHDDAVYKVLTSLKDIVERKPGGLKE